MLMKFLGAGGLVMVTVAIHAVGLSALLRAMLRSHALGKSGFRFVAGLVIVLAAWLVLLHMVEISLWGLAYYWWGCMPDPESGIYFSGVTYTTLGYGDQLLPKPWRMLAPLEAVTGILMCGLSTGLFFAVVNRFISRWAQTRIASEAHDAAPTHGH
jgi:hypothetical protein